MVKFDCTWCGKCCTSFGEFIKIERQLSDRDYYCRYGITNEIFPVHVQSEFSDEIGDRFLEQDETGKGSPRKGCVFLCKNPAGKGVACAIYPTRPNICREFKCYRMLIHHKSSGEIRGRVIGINELRTQDEILIAIWREKIATLPHPIHAQPVAAQHSHVSGAAASCGHASHVFAHLQGTEHPDDSEWVDTVIAVLADYGYNGEPVE